MTGDFAVDVPTYDAVFAGLAKQWPQLPEELRVCEFIRRHENDLENCLMSKTTLTNDDGQGMRKLTTNMEA